MKKALGLLAIIGSATALVAYKLKKDEKKNDDLMYLEEEDISERILRTAEAQNFSEEDFQQEPARETNTYPNLNEEDILRLNALSEENFVSMDEKALENNEERPLQHTLVFTTDIDLENYKNKVINEGYVVTVGENEKELIVLNITATTPDTILQKVYHLADLGKQFNAQYKGWILK